MALGDGIRRNIAAVTKAERDRFRDAIIALNHQFYPGGRSDTPVGGVSYWFKQDEIHQSTHVHNCPAFLPWHRELLNRFEALLRLIDPALSLHYWDWTTDPSWMFTSDFMGNAHGDAGDPWLSGGLYNPGASPNRDSSDNPFDPPLHITRGVGESGIPLPTPIDDQNVLDAPDFVEFHNRITPIHNNMHGFIGGTLSNAHTSFRDPFVFLLHSNIDRLLAMWQRHHCPTYPERLDPAQVYGAWENTQGSGDVSLLDPNWGILSPLEPWAGVNAQTPATGIIANVVSTRPWAPPENQTVYKDSRDPTVVNPPSYDTSLPTPPTVIDSYTVGPLRLQIFAATSDCAQHPSVDVVVPDGWHILGGGAFVDWLDGVCTGLDWPPPGNLLTAMYPLCETVWRVASKDHVQASPAQITGYCIAAQMQDGTPIPPGAYQIFSQESAVAELPSTEVFLPDGWVLVGGGARANYTGPGSLLYASVPLHLPFRPVPPVRRPPPPPVRRNGWFAAAKAHIEPDPATVTAFAIGLTYSFLVGAGLAVTHYPPSTTPIPTHHPWVTLVIPDSHLVSGGAQVNWALPEPGNLLTASFPQDRQTWIARGKDHLQPDPATITAWGIGLVPA